MTTKRALQGLGTSASIWAWPALLCVLTPLSAMANIVVDAGATPCITASAHFTSIQAAVNAAPSGAVISVCPGNYAEQITIGTSLTLQGVTNTSANTGAAVITPPTSGLATNGGAFLILGNGPIAVQVLVQAANVNLVDLAVDGTGAYSDCGTSPALVGIGYGANSSGSLKRVAVRNQAVPLQGGGYCQFGFGGAGVGILSLSTTGLTVADSSIRGFSSIGVWSYAGVVQTSVVNSVTGTNAICVGGYNSQAPGIQIRNNTISNCAWGVDDYPLNSATASEVTGNTIVNVISGIVIPSTVGSVGGTYTIYGNTIAGAAYAGIVLGFGAGAFSNIPVTIQYNDISAVNSGIVFWSPTTGGTATQNTVIDAVYGVIGVTGNSVSGNRFLNVTTLQL